MFKFYKKGGVGSDSGIVKTGSTSPTVARYVPARGDLVHGTVLQYWLPKHPKEKNALWRKIYREDPIAGPVVDLYKDLPWSDVVLAQIKDDTIRQFYEDALSELGILDHLGDMTAEFIYQGRFCSHMMWDDSKGYWTRFIPHDLDHIEIEPIPIVGFPPKVDLLPTAGMKRFATSRDPRDEQARKMLSPELVTAIQKGQKIPLSPANTIYIARKLHPGDYEGTSLYYRLLGFHAYEQGIIDGGLVAVRRRLGAIRAVKVGTEQWEPTLDELNDIVDLVVSADEDPVGAVVAFRQGVEFDQITGAGAGEILKWSDEWAFLNEGKMRALGVSDAFLTGEATYNTMEQLMSVFLERLRALRDMFTNGILMRRWAIPLARVHKFVRRTEAELTHRIRLSSGNDPKESDLILPNFQWKKALKPVADKDFMDILTAAAEKGLPISLRTWAAVSGMDLDAELTQLDEDYELRQRLRKYRLFARDDVYDILKGAYGDGVPIPLELMTETLGFKLDELLSTMVDDVRTRTTVKKYMDVVESGGEASGPLFTGPPGGAGGTPVSPGGGAPAGPGAAAPGGAPRPTPPPEPKPPGGGGEPVAKETQTAAGLYQGIAELLPHFASSNEFLGVIKHDFMDVVGNMLNGGSKKMAAVLQQNKKRSQVLRYLLARVGLHDMALVEEDVFNDIKDEIVNKMNLRNAMYEIGKMHLACVSRSDITGEKTSEDEKAKKRHPEFSIPRAESQLSSARLLTGHGLSRDDIPLPTEKKYTH